MIVYKYGALKPRVIDGKFLDLLDYQKQSNWFYNALVEIERWRLAAAAIVELLQGAPLSLEQKTEHRLAYNAACRGAGKATKIGWGQKQAVTEMVAAALKKRRDGELRAERKAVAKNWHYLKRVLAVPRPRYKRHDGTMLLAATVQGASGLMTGSVLAGTTNLSLSGVGKKRTLKMRLREGLEIEIPIAYHRPLPDETRVVFARLVIDRIGNRWVYSVHLTLDMTVGRRRMGIGRCAVNFGWRRVDDGVRVAYLVDDEGREESLVVPQRLFDKILHAESVRGVADAIADKFLGDGARRAKARLMALSAPSATHRELGKVHLTPEQIERHSSRDMEQWARRDRHLVQWERDEYSKALRMRKELYLQWAQKIAAKYDTCRIETFDIRNVIERGPNEMSVPSARHYRFLVGPHYLRLAIKAEFGASLEVLKPEKLTQYCHVCGNLCKWNRAAELMHDCERCGATWDQDANNAKNQLASAAE